jgi:hypothetical protein
MNINHRVIQLLPTSVHAISAPAPRTCCKMAIEEDPPPLHIVWKFIGVISCAITGHATLHVPILVGPILRVEKEGPIT